MQHVLILGPSGVGKGTIVNYLLKNYAEKFTLSISCTSRPMRPGDENGVNYHFISRDNFLQKIKLGDFLEFEEYSGNLYGTLKSEIDRIESLGKRIIFEVEPRGALNIKNYLKDKIEDLFIAPTNLAELENMLRNRDSDSEDQIQKRMQTAIEIELPMQSRFSHVIVNEFGQLDKTISKIKNILGI